MANSLAGLDYDDYHVVCAPALRFTVGDEPSGSDPSGDARRLIAAANSAGKRRGDHGPNVEDLEISLVYSSSRNRYRAGPFTPAGYAIEHGHAEDITSAHVAEWLHFAARRVTGRLTVAVPTAPNHKPFDLEEAKRKFVAELPAYARADGMLVFFGNASPTVSDAVPDKKAVCEQDQSETRKLVAELPASARASAMQLALGNASLTVPTAGTGALDALTDLRLSHARIEPGSADEANLGRMLSMFCCPRLRCLRLEYLRGLAALRIDAAGTLEELSLERLSDITSLELDGPGLRALRIVGCAKMLYRDVMGPVARPMRSRKPNNRYPLEEWTQ